VSFSRKKKPSFDGKVVYKRRRYSLTINHLARITHSQVAETFLAGVGQSEAECARAAFCSVAQNYEDVDRQEAEAVAGSVS